MRIKMLSLYAGPDGVITPGDVVEVSAETGQALLAGGFAVAVDAEGVSLPRAEKAEAPKRGRTAEKP
jgi:hypothetical protein